MSTPSELNSCPPLPKPPTFPSFTIIDPDGDVILIVGKDKIRIQVSSIALCLASKVFKKKNSLGGFREGMDGFG
jgi:hypothetical protein